MSSFQALRPPLVVDASFEIEALDGSLRIASAEGGPTVIEAVLPCAR